MSGSFANERHCPFIPNDMRNPRDEYSCIIQGISRDSSLFPQEFRPLSTSTVIQSIPWRKNLTYSTVSGDAVKPAWRHCVKMGHDLILPPSPSSQFSLLYPFSSLSYHSASPIISRPLTAGFSGHRMLRNLISGYKDLYACARTKLNKASGYPR